MENEIERILSERLGSIVASVVLIYIFFWWKARKKKREQSVPAGEQKEKSPLSEVTGYLKWRFKLAIGTIIVLIILYLLFYRR